MFDPGTKYSGDFAKVAAALGKSFDDLAGAFKITAIPLPSQVKRTYEDLAKNDPEALARLFEKDPQEFNRLAREHERRRDLPGGWPPV